MAQLEFEGLIVRQPGRGTFAGTRAVESLLDAERPLSFEEQMEQMGALVTFRLIGFEPEAAPSPVASALNVKEGDLVYRLRRLRLVDDEVISYEDRRMPSWVGAAVPAAALTNQSAVRIVEAALGSPLGGMSVTVSATMAGVEAAKLLGISRRGPLLVRSHVFFDPEGQPILEGKSLYRGDKYHFTYRFGRGP